MEQALPNDNHLLVFYSMGNLCCRKQRFLADNDGYDERNHIIVVIQRLVMNLVNNHPVVRKDSQTEDPFRKRWTKYDFSLSLVLSLPFPLQSANQFKCPLDPFVSQGFIWDNDRVPYKLL